MDETRFKLIIIIVSEGKADKVVKVAHSAGASGATIINGHGAAVRLFLGVSIDPEKELVLIVLEEEKAKAVIETIAQEMELANPNKGLAFMLSLDQVFGLSPASEDERD
ncbi:MAG: P-II family nitrogen regulator [Coriobacteriia bacterium]|nr:P-II family nitrogen regulator [Coriobacteriia bacterium]